VLVAGAATGVNPQTAPRITITGLAEPTADPVLKARYLAVHPYAGMYAHFADFSLWRVRLLGGLYVGGFASAARLRASELVPDQKSVTTLAAAEPEIIARCNADQSEMLARIAGGPGDWRMVSIDIDGCDLAQGEHVIRVHWSAPVADPEGIRRELNCLGSTARPG
jgi:putative heme iron utilization protein